jgi:hypothetical protein
MNAPTLGKPTQPQPTGEAILLVAVKITIREPLQDFTPNRNLIGTKILDGCFEAELRRRNLLVQALPSAGELNDSYFLYEVSALPPALTMVDELLCGIGLRGNASILFYRHDLFRPYEHDGAQIGVGFSEVELLRLAKEEREKWQRVLEAWEYLKQVYAKRRAAEKLPPDSEPPSTPPPNP